MNKKQLLEQERQEAIDRLRSMLKPGDTVYTVLRHVSRSGMMRHIDLYVFKTNEDGKIYKQWLSYNAAKAMDYRLADDDSIKVGGAGMDMGFHLVYSLSRTLFPKGFTLEEGKRYGRNTANGVDTDGGYALNQEWI